MPWVDQDSFDNIYSTMGSDSAISWLYDQSEKLHLIHRDTALTGTYWQHESPWGPILISVNEAKPEKDPLEIAAVIKAAQNEPRNNSSHDNCVFCWNAPTEINHLRALVHMHNEAYSLHFSPYAYFPEHCIIACEAHKPMTIDEQTLSDLLELCTMFPGYFFGSNADLPIVGGSILDHHHYQGGRFNFPIESASPCFSFTLPGYDDISASLLQWPLACIRLSSLAPSDLCKAATAILKWWQTYDDPAIGIIARSSDGILHNTITPVARKKDARYEMELILRCNITTEEYPLGVFHPHNEIHCVKKENIGLIEAMGLAILPPRVLDQFELGEESSLSDRVKVGELFTRGLEQCNVLPTPDSKKRAVDSLVEYLQTTRSETIQD